MITGKFDSCKSLAIKGNAFHSLSNMQFHSIWLLFCAVTSADDTMLKLINNARAAAGVEPLCYNKKLINASLDWANRMRDLGFFDHVDPETGSTIGARVSEAGYQWQTVGENIAKGQETDVQAFNSWWNSKGHRENMLNCNFRHLGWAMVDRIWVQIFANGQNEQCS